MNQGVLTKLLKLRVKYTVVRRKLVRFNFTFLKNDLEYLSENQKQLST